MKTKETATRFKETHSPIRTYRGRPGCGCGCKGTYSENKGATTRRLREAGLAIVHGEKATITDCREGGFCVALENDERFLWLYFPSYDAACAFVGRSMVGDCV